MVNIGITGTGSLIGQAIIKSIKNSNFNENYRLIGFDYFKNTVGSFWCSKNYILPDLLKKELEDSWLISLVEIIKKEKIEVLFAGVDFELPLLAKNKKKIEQETACTVVVSSEDVIRIGNDKYLTYQFLKENGLSYPKTYLPKNCDLKLLDFPVIVKPRIGARSVGVSIVHSAQEIDDVISETENPVIQELVGNESNEYTCGVIAFNGEVKQVIVLKRSLKAGNTFISEFKKDFSKKIYSYVYSIASILGIYGSCNFQLRVDTNGIPKLFEINPRHSGTTYIRSLFGYNEILFILQYILDSSEMKFELKEGKVMRYFEEVIIE